MDNLLNTDMMDSIDPNVVERLLSAKPFYKIEGGFNLRDLSDVNYPALKPGYAFRSGSLENLTPQGQQDLVQLGVKTYVCCNAERFRDLQSQLLAPRNLVFIWKESVRV